MYDHLCIINTMHGLSGHCALGVLSGWRPPDANVAMTLFLLFHFKLEEPHPEGGRGDVVDFI